MAPVVTMKQLLDAGVHFGHQTRRWNPKMKRFLHGERQGIYIIDLEQTLDRVRIAYEFVRDMTAEGGNLLFVGTKKQASDAVEQYALSCNMPYVNQRWLGGMLTNFETISKRVSKMAELERQRDTGEFDAMPKKEALMNTRELDKLLRNLNGIRNLERKPDAVFVLDTKKEHIAVTEANKLKIPLIAVVDTNCDPDVINYVIPGNDDAIRSGSLMCRIMADAVKEGRFIRSKKVPSDSGPVAPAVRTPEEEAEIARQQAEARDQAAAQAAEREARVAAAKTAEDAGETAPEAPAAAPEAPAAEAAAAEAPAAEAAPEAAAPEAEAPATETPAEAAAPEAAPVETPAEAVAEDAAEVAAEAPAETTDTETTEEG
jgi:small subunit ribosomal protein S2